MTNEVEKLIIENKKQPKMDYSDIIAYNFYKELWKFFLYANKYDYDEMNINFNVIKKENLYISKYSGINYEIKGDNYQYKWKTFYDECEEYYIESVLNTNINVDILCKLLKSDKINYTIEENHHILRFNINTSKEQINELINHVLLKNKCLKKIR
ncbi:MAG: hypothetical protein IJD92_01435 [Bacilli bacterium]|nr:hypothetical protein [Bacilli bacterium]